MIVNVGGNQHRMSGRDARVLINIAKEKYKREGTNAIVALEKPGYIEMRRDTFTDPGSLMTQVNEYIKAGFKVSYLRVEEGNSNGK